MGKMNWGQAAQVAVNVGSGLFSQWAGNRYARKAQDRMNKYNSPKEQMKRFREAGLNPNLVYDQGNPGNQSQPVPAPDFSRIAPDTISAYNQTRMTTAQVAATDAKTNQSVAQTSLIKLRESIEKTNPVLNETGLKAMVDAFLASSSIKVLDAGMKQHSFEQSFTRNRVFVENGMKIAQAEWDAIVKKYDLLNKDDQIKANILKQQDFQNDMNAIQKRFMESGDVTSQHILDFVKMFLSSLMKTK